MDIKNISVYGNHLIDKNDTSDNTSSNISKKAQTTISNVANVTSVNFKNTGADAASSSYSLEDYIDAGVDTVAAKVQEKENLSVLTGEDYEGIEQEEGSVMDANQESVERACERIKEQKAWDAEKLQENIQLRKELQESLEKIQATGFLSQKSEAQLRQVLEDAGIPATAENISQIISALGMSQDALALTDQSKTYIIGQNLDITIENLYQGKYSVYGGQFPTNVVGQNFSDYEEQVRNILAECQRVDENSLQEARWLFEHELPINETTLDKLETLQDIQESMTLPKVLEQIIFSMVAGYSPKDANLDDGQFIVAKNAVQDFQNISDSTIAHTADTLLENVQQDEEGLVRTGQASDQSEEGVSVNLEFLRQMEKEEKQSSDEKTQIPVVYTEGMSQSDILQITIKRQVEEIRQKMTIQAAVRMGQKGIYVDTESLENIIKELRDIENTYYSQQIGKNSDTIVDSELDLFQETLSKTSDIANSHAVILGSSVRQRTLLTVNELHAAIRSATANRNDWNGVYERVATDIRKDLGDSIQKAFKNIPDILKSIDMDVTQANERAVRILGYNSMEITKENIEQVKMFDAKVNQVIENMKPSTVLELIHRGENPLDIPLDRLNEELAQINGEKDITSEEKYSRYLWQLEKSHQITQEERAGYIGVYRLLNQIEKSDGAVVGAVLESQQELTLGNLLTQARTMKGNGIDSRIDDKTGFGEINPKKMSITDQIQLGFSQNKDNSSVASQHDSVDQMNTVSESKQQVAYQQNLISKTLDELTPSKLQEMTDGDLNKLLDVSVETLFEQLKSVSGDETLHREYYETQARKLREDMASSEEAKEYLSKMQVEATITNMVTAKMMIEEGYSPYSEFYNSRKKAAKEELEEFDDIVDSFEENMEDEESLNAQCAKSEKIMEEILMKSSEQADIKFEDLKRFQQIGRGIHLEGLLRSSHSYDIPIRTGDSITSLNLTIIHGTDESGKIQVSMEDESLGNISMDFRVSKDSIKGLVLCDQRQGFETLQEQGETLEDNLEGAGYQVKNISYGMDFKSRNELLNETIKAQEADTKQLYQIAKILVRSVTAVIRENNMSY